MNLTFYRLLWRRQKRQPRHQVTCSTISKFLRAAREDFAVEEIYELHQSQKVRVLSFRLFYSQWMRYSFILFAPCLGPEWDEIEFSYNTDQCAYHH